VFFVMKESTHVAKLSLAQTIFDPTGWKHATDHSILAPFMVEDVSWPEFAQAQEPRPVYNVRFVPSGQNSSQGEAWKVVTGQESFRSQIAVWIKIGFCLFLCAIQEKVNLSLSFHTITTRIVTFLLSSTWPVFDLAGLIPLEYGTSVKFAPAVKGTIKLRWRIAQHALQPTGVEPECAQELLAA
jgi:hypothetical protein